MKRLNLCLCCSNGGHHANQCKLKRSCGKDGCTRKHNRLLHMDGNSQANSQLTDADANPVLAANACSGILLAVSVKLSNGIHSVDKLAVCDTGSTLSFIDSVLKSFLGINGTKLTLSVPGRNDTSDMRSEKVSVKVSANNLHEFLTFH